MTKWQIVTNGNKFRLRNDSGEFYSTPVATIYGTVGRNVVTFSSYEGASAKRFDLEAIKRNNTWVPVDDK